MKITRRQVWADDGGWSNTSHRKRFRSIFVAAAVCGGTLSWGRTIPEDIIPRRWFWIKEPNYSSTPHLAGDSIILGMFTGSLRAQNWQVRCVAFDGNTRDIAQHICAKVHLILIVVLISRPIGPWKKNSPRIFQNFMIFIHRILKLWKIKSIQNINSTGLLVTEILFFN